MLDVVAECVELGGGHSAGELAGHELALEGFWIDAGDFFLEANEGSGLAEVEVFGDDVGCDFCSAGEDLLAELEAFLVDGSGFCTAAAAAEAAATTSAAAATSGSKGECGEK